MSGPVPFPPVCLKRLARAIKMNLANEGLEARKKDEEIAGKKRKAEEDRRWEGRFSFLFLARLLILAPLRRL